MLAREWLGHWTHRVPFPLTAGCAIRPTGSMTLVRRKTSAADAAPQRPVRGHGLSVWAARVTRRGTTTVA